jgi:hypothetical protein
MKLHKLTIVYLVLLFLSRAVSAKDRVELDTAIIKGNKESPAILYIVPWKEMRIYNDEYQGFMIDDLQGDILTPVFPGDELLKK